MMGSVVERTKEIGVLRALGFRRTHIIKELMIEVTAVSALGGLVGWGAGLLASRVALPYFTETQIGLDVDPMLAVIAVCGSLIIGGLSSIYPAIRASKLDPSEAVRYV
jgi:putative ABC transport system permease protein